MEKFELINKFINNDKYFDVDFYYWDFLKELKNLLDLYNKEKETNQALILYFKEKLNNIEFEIETSWRKIEKYEKELLKEE